MTATNRSVVLYRRLLRLYPKRFRDEYGDDMVFVFEEMLRDLPAGRVWLRTLRDATSSIVIQRLETTMSVKSAFVPLGLAALAAVTLVVVSARGVDNLAVFLASVAVTGALVTAALIYWYGQRPYVEPADQVNRYWLRCLGGGGALIGVVNLGSAVDIEAPWIVLFTTIIFGVLLVALGIILGLWRGVDRVRTA
jgi:hypothetical protein